MSGENLTREMVDEAIVEIKKMPEEQRNLLLLISIYVLSCVIDESKLLDENFDSHRDSILNLLTKEEKDVLNT